MKKISAKMNATLRVAGFVLASLILCNISLAQQPPDDVQGNWTIYATNANTGQVEIKHVQIAQYGNRITGYFEGPFQSGPIEGEVHGHHIRFNTVTRNVLHFSGDVFGDTMSGTYGIRGKHAPWQATRPATASIAVPSGSGAAYSTQPALVPPTAQSAYEESAQTSYQAPTSASTLAPPSAPTPAYSSEPQ